MLRRTVGTPFLRRGVDSLGRSELVYLLSGEYGWFGPREAEDVVDHAVEAGVLEGDAEGDGGLAPGFARDRVEPLDGDADPVFEDLLQESGDSDVDSGVEGGSDGVDGVFERAVETLSSGGYSRKEAVAEINRQHRRLGDVDVEAAAVLAVKREGEEVDDLVETALRRLRSS